MTTTPNLALTQYATTDTINWLTQYNSDMSKVDTTSGKLSNLTTTSKTNLVSAINESVTNIGTLASLKTAVKTSTVGAINEVYDTTDNGWISARATLTYASASAPTFVCNTNIDLTTRISVGMKLKLTQTTTKYFFVTAIDATGITLYGGTDYVLTNTAITDVYLSVVKSPFGFPLNPNKWGQSIVVTTNSSHSVTANIWKDTNIKLKIPVGDWSVEADYFATATNIPSPYGALVWTCFLPNPTNSSTMSAIIASDELSSTECRGRIHLSDSVRIESETVYTLYLKTLLTIDNVTLDCTNGNAVFKATCAYL